MSQPNQQNEESENKMSFDEEYYLNETFNGKDLSESELKEKEFTGCSFEKVNFEKAKLKYVRFENCTFKNCNLGLVKLTGSRFIDCEFFDCKMIGINWTEVEEPVKIKIENSKIDYSIFFAMDLRRIEITECEAREVNFENADISKGKFNGTNFISSKFKNTNLSASDFREAMNYDINPEFNKIKKAKFSMPEVMTLLQCFDIEIC